MLDPFLVPHIVAKVRRVCANPLCTKHLASLNKQELCFSCHSQAMLRRSQLTSYQSSASKSLR